MPVFIKIKINDTIEAFIKQEDIENFTISRNIKNPIIELTLEIRNIEKYLNLFLTKISFFQLVIIVNNSVYDFETYYPYKSELKGSKIILNSINIKEDLSKTLYNRVFYKQSLQAILDKLAEELGCIKALLDRSLKHIKINKLEQNNKTNLSIIEELSEIFYAYAYRVPEGLLFIQPSRLNRNIFVDIPEAVIADNKIVSIKKSASEYKLYKGVKYRYFNKTSNSHRKLFAGVPPYLEIESPYDEEITTKLTQSKYKKIREQVLLELTVSQGMNFNINMYISIPTTTERYQQFIGIYFINNIKYSFYDNKLTTHIVAYEVH